MEDRLQVQRLRTRSATSNNLHVLSLMSLFPSFGKHSKPFLLSVAFRTVDLHFVLFDPRFFCRSECSYTNLAVRVSFVINTYCVHTLTFCTEHSPSWEASRFSAGQEIPSILWNPKVYYHVYKYSPPVPVLSQIDPVHTLTSHFLTKRSVPQPEAFFVDGSWHDILLQWGVVSNSPNPQAGGPSLVFCP